MSSNDKLLFTPGPLTTSETVKQAMLRDLGSRDEEFISAVARIRNKLLDVAGVSQDQGYEAIPIQGSGTFSIESVISSAVAPNGKLLVVINGAYGDRINKIANTHGIETIVVKGRENELPNIEAVESELAASDDIAMVAIVHCETTSGIMNPIEQVGRICKKYRKSYFVDSMSAFGAVQFDFAGCHIDYLVSSANKCIQGVPGFGFVICRRDALLETEGWSRTVSLDLLNQWRGLEANGQFRFTPPTHVLLAFEQALDELEAEGGVVGRTGRYQQNHQNLLAGMKELGFEEYVPRELQGHIITSFRYPQHLKFGFEQFYGLLSKRGYLIYPGKVTNADCFRIGNIGHIFPADIQGLLEAIAEALKEMERG